MEKAATCEKKMEKAAEEFACELCGSLHPTQLFLVAHKDDKHIGSGKKINCNICTGMYFRHWAALEQHYNNRQKKSYKLCSNKKCTGPVSKSTKSMFAKNRVEGL
ncbi:hypothetical protein ACFX2A_001841 [Malus domestica]